MDEDIQKQVEQTINDWKKNKPENKQLAAIQDMVEMLVLIEKRLYKGSDESAKTKKELNERLDKVLEQLKVLADKEDPEAPDYASPVVDEIRKLQDTIAKQEMKPEFKVPEIKLPKISVPKAEVSLPTINVPALDTKPLVKAVKGLVGDFANSIPEQDNSDILETLNKLINVTEEVRDRPMPLPEFPNSFAVNNDITANSTAYDLQVDDTGTYTYLGNALPGTATSATTWRIKRVTNATGVITHADGVSSFTKEWDERASYSY